MPTVAKDILDECRSTYLNDPSAGQYTDEKLLSPLKTAYGLLQSELEANGIQCKNEEVVTTILANTNEYYPLPPDLVIPRVILERTPGSTEEYIPVTFRSNIPIVTPGPTLQYWSYRLERIYFLPATQNREIKLLYQKSFPAVNTADAALFGKAENFLAAAVAALVFNFMTQNPSLAESAKTIAEKELEEIIGLQIKLLQMEPVRRKGYLPFRTR